MPTERPPTEDVAEQGAADQPNKQEMITSRQAAEMLSLLRRIEQSTQETTGATEGVRDALTELVAEIPKLGTMTK